MEIFQKLFREKEITFNETCIIIIASIVTNGRLFRLQYIRWNDLDERRLNMKLVGILLVAHQYQLEMWRLRWYIHTNLHTMVRSMVGRTSDRSITSGAKLLETNDFSLNCFVIYHITANFDQIKYLSWECTRFMGNPYNTVRYNTPGNEEHDVSDI